MIDLRSRASVSVPVRDAKYPAPFASGLEYAAPARGTWNIVHLGMLIPESHQIFVCAQGCLRGVVLTAAEMGATSRFSTVSVDESNLLNGDFEASMVDGVTQILEGMEKRPRAVLLFSSCIHHFAACDLKLVFTELRARFPQIDFTDCYMTPTLRKTITPDARMRRQLYSLLEPLPREERRLNLIGSALPMRADSELLQMLDAGGVRVCDLTACRTYEEYLDLARASWNISCIPSAKAAGEMLEERLSQRHIHLPISHDMDEIEAGERKVAKEMDLPLPDFGKLREAAEEAFSRARLEIGQTPLSIDYTATPRPLGLARALSSRGYFVRDVFLDAIAPEEREDLAWLRENTPEMLLHLTTHPSMRVADRTGDGNTLAIGQKAAYFTGTDRFVNLVEGGGLFGLAGMRALAEEMLSAFRTPKDTRKIIQVKGWGCCG